MSELEKFMKDKRNLFDSDSPSSGHEERFLQKLSRRPVRRFNVRHALQVAASVAIILASAFVVIRQNRSRDKVAEAGIPPILKEAGHFYTTQLNARYDQIRQFSFENPEEKTLLLDELKDLDAHHRQLITDLKAHPDDERIINALIRHYQMKLEVMDQVIIHLQQFKSEHNENHENKSI